MIFDVFFMEITYDGLMWRKKEKHLKILNVYNIS